MSYTSLYGVPLQGCLRTVSEYRNGWGSAPVIWDFIWDKYLRTRETEKNYESAMHPNGNLQKICDMANEGKLLEYERICVHLTYDRCIIRKEDFAKVSDALDTMYLATYNGVHVNHLKAISSDLRDSDKWNDYIGCCFRHTSVGDEWTVYGDKDDDCRLYDISRDTGHWFLNIERTSDPHR